MSLSFDHASTIVESLRERSFDIDALKTKVEEIDLKAGKQALFKAFQAIQKDLIAVADFIGRIASCNLNSEDPARVLELVTASQKNLFYARERITKIFLEKDAHLEELMQDEALNPLIESLLDLAAIYRESIEPNVDSLEALNFPSSVMLGYFCPEDVFDAVHLSCISYSLRRFCLQEKNNDTSMDHQIENPRASSIEIRKDTQTLDQTFLYQYMDQLTQLYQGVFDSDDLRKHCDLIYDDLDKFLQGKQQRTVKFSESNPHLSKLYTRLKAINEHFSVKDLVQSVRDEKQFNNTIAVLTNILEHQLTDIQPNEFAELALTLLYLRLKHEANLQLDMGVIEIDTFKKLGELNRDDRAGEDLKALWNAQQIAHRILHPTLPIDLQRLDQDQVKAIGVETIGLARELEKSRFGVTDFSDPDFIINRIIDRYKFIFLKAAPVNHNIYEELPEPIDKDTQATKTPNEVSKDTKIPELNHIQNIFKTIKSSSDDQALITLINNIANATINCNSINAQEAAELIYILARGGLNVASDPFYIHLWERSIVK